MFKSEAQRRKLFADKPALAREFEAHTPKDAKLPERVGQRKPDGRRKNGVADIYKSY